MNKFKCAIASLVAISSLMATFMPNMAIAAPAERLSDALVAAHGQKTRPSEDIMCSMNGVEIHFQPLVGSAVLGFCGSSDVLNSIPPFIESGDSVYCGGGYSSDSWYYFHDVTADVTGYVSYCFIGIVK